jgi:hypothetical protein
MKATVIIFVSGIITYSLFSCECQSGDYYDFVTANSFGFIVADEKSKQNILSIGQTNYNYDTLKVYNSDWTVASNVEPGDGVVYLDFIERKDKGQLALLISRNYYMYFNYLDTDTIKIDFKMRTDECDEQIVEYFRVSYNDSIYFDESTSFVPGITFLKKK